MGTKARKKSKVSFGRRVGNTLTKFFQVGIHVTHLGLKYTTDSVENLEANVMHYADGIDKQDTIKYRQAHSVLVQLQIKAKIAEIKQKIADFTVIKPEGGDEVANETVAFNGSES